ncbi:HEPN domain-containing protein [Candidatus Peregrinibacteria bacterium]|nr:HEPN domain-containing protein [Candidatus Peregrinibacteria bacterium]
MLPKDKIEAQIDYWLSNAAEKFKTMQGLYTSKRYADCLFFGHMVLEMALKAHVVIATKEVPPKIHNLRRLAEMAKLDLKDDEWKLLVKASNFNMEARYPDEKLEFHKMSTKSTTDEYYEPIISLYKKLCRKNK